MQSSDLKEKIIREIDRLENEQLQEVYGHIRNVVRSQKDLSDWDRLSSAQQDGLYQAINELDSGKGVVHEEVMRKYRKKSPDA